MAPEVLLDSAEPSDASDDFIRKIAIGALSIDTKAASDPVRLQERLAEAATAPLPTIDWSKLVDGASGLPVRLPLAELRALLLRHPALRTSEYPKLGEADEKGAEQLAQLLAATPLEPRAS